MGEIWFNYDSLYANVCICMQVTVIIPWLCLAKVLCFYLTDSSPSFLNRHLPRFKIKTGGGNIAF